MLFNIQKALKNINFTEKYKQGINLKLLFFRRD